MYERLLDKKAKPSLEQIIEYLGEDSTSRLLVLEEFLQTHYQLSKEVRFPFGNTYGWGYKYSHKSSHLCYAFFEKGAFTVTIQIGDKQAALVEDCLQEFSKKAAKLWEDRYPCGENGGWIHYRVLGDEDLNDVYKFIKAKKKPIGV